MRDTRISFDQIENGELINGFDYDLQVWVENQIVQECGHPDSMGSRCCNARRFKGLTLEQARHEVAREARDRDFLGVA